MKTNAANLAPITIEVRREITVFHGEFSELKIYSFNQTARENNLKTYQSDL
jgi:hypothetical protein